MGVVVGIVVAVVLAALAAGMWFVLRNAGRSREALARIREAHAGAAVLPTALFEGPASPPERARVIAVVADRRGLSFRDRLDAEVLRVDADVILSLELAPLAPRGPRPARLERIDGPPLAFWAGATPDQQLDTIVALRTALGRPLG